MNLRNKLLKKYEEIEKNINYEDYIGKECIRVDNPIHFLEFPNHKAILANYNPTYYLKFETSLSWRYCLPVEIFEEWLASDLELKYWYMKRSR
jgi:hypothetical protein